MSLSLGTLDAAAIAVGSTEVQTISLGTDVAWSATPPSPLPDPLVIEFDTNLAPDGVNAEFRVHDGSAGSVVRFDWGDGTTSDVPLVDGTWTEVTHTFPSIDVFSVGITLIVGDEPLRITSSGNRGIVAVTEWGDMDATTPITVNQRDLVSVPAVAAPYTDYTILFNNCFVFNQDISGWDVSNVTDMSNMFVNASAFNQDLSAWDVSNVTDMSNMFNNSGVATGDYTSWDVSNVTDMGWMFSSTPFNGDISSWDTSSVTDMTSMFSTASFFNGDLSGWDTSAVTKMGYMFNACSSFDSDISGWDTSGVTDMTWMLRGASSFNQDLSGWDVSLISAEPSSFDTGATSWVLPRPVWGTDGT